MALGVDNTRTYSREEKQKAIDIVEGAMATYDERRAAELALCEIARSTLDHTNDECDTGTSVRDGGRTNSSPSPHQEDAHEQLAAGASNNGTNGTRFFKCARCGHLSKTKNNSRDHESKQHVGPSCSWRGCNFASAQQDAAKAEKEVRDHIGQEHIAADKNEDGNLPCLWMNGQGNSCGSHAFKDRARAKNAACIHCHKEALRTGTLPQAGRPTEVYQAAAGEPVQNEAEEGDEDTDHKEQEQEQDQNQEGEEDA
ncbi:hypothetical protein F4818DRAFT_437556 [Hypoxylon cercidicola]|nr:hypothetical protein F4818DRAFT_437556 [Hypoxylon cercidicola]